MGKNCKNIARMELFLTTDPQDLKSGSVTFVPLRCPNLMQKQDKHKMDTAKLNLSQQLCQSINTL